VYKKLVYISVLGLFFVSGVLLGHYKPELFSYGVVSNIKSFLIGPTLNSSSPSDGATGINIDSNIILHFNENVYVGRGNITLKSSLDDSDVEIISVSDDRITGDESKQIIIDLSNNLSNSSDYYLNIDSTAFLNSERIPYVGISDSSTLNFRTNASPISVYDQSIYRLYNNFEKGTCGSKDKGYSFFIAGHVYGTPNVKYNGIYNSFKTNSELNNCEFMPLGIFLGDVVQEASNYEFNIFKNDMESIGNKTEIYISPGNHDVGKTPYSAKRDIYLQNFGETFKYFEYQNDLFIVLDANLNRGNIISDQLEMLKSLQLNDNNYNNIFIFSHQVIWIDPLKTTGLIPNKKFSEKLNFWNQVFPVISDIGEKVFVFAGDVGAFDNKSEFFYDNILGVDFFATGMGGGVRDNYLLIHVRNDKVEIELIKL
jgi:hypothetical protein